MRVGDPQEMKRGGSVRSTAETHQRKYLCSALIGFFIFLTQAWWVEGVIPNRASRLTPDDLFRLEKLGDKYFRGYAFSPDGKWLVYVIKRPEVTSTNHESMGYLLGNECSDVWLVSTNGGQPVNLTKGSADGAGFWNAVW